MSRLCDMLHVPPCHNVSYLISEVVIAVQHQQGEQMLIYSLPILLHVCLLFLHRFYGNMLSIMINRLGVRASTYGHRMDTVDCDGTNQKRPSTTQHQRRFLNHSTPLLI
jgi:hypothetical protein